MAYASTVSSGPSGPASATSGGDDTSGKSGTPEETEFRIGQQVRTNTFEATLTFRGGNRREEEKKITIRREANGVYCLDE